MKGKWTKEQVEEAVKAIRQKKLKRNKQTYGVVVHRDKSFIILEGVLKKTKYTQKEVEGGYWFFETHTILTEPMWYNNQTLHHIDSVDLVFQDIDKLKECIKRLSHEYLIHSINEAEDKLKGMCANVI